MVTKEEAQLIVQGKWMELRDSSKNVIPLGISFMLPANFIMTMWQRPFDLPDVSGRDGYYITNSRFIFDDENEHIYDSKTGWHNTVKCTTYDGKPYLTLYGTNIRKDDCGVMWLIEEEEHK